MTDNVILPSSEIWSRDDFPALCFWRKLYRCVEVGVDRGAWSRLFLDRFPQIEEWHGVDDWKTHVENTHDRDPDYRMALANLQPYSTRAKLILTSSVEAAKQFAPGSVDFVYIDASHDHESVAADLRAWWSTVSDHGILAGHDFDDTHPGVMRAVREFAAEVGQTVYLTAVDGYNRESFPSWYVYRSGMPGADWRRC